MGRTIRSRGPSESRMPGRVPSGSEVQPAEVPARMATTGVPAGRMPAGSVPASRVAPSASVLRHCGGEETDHAQQNRKDVRRPHKKGNSSGHDLTTPGNVGSVYSSCGARECDFQLEETLGAGGSRSARGDRHFGLRPWDFSTPAPFLNGTDARLSHRGREFRKSAASRDEILLGVRCGSRGEVGCSRLDRRRLPRVVGGPRKPKQTSFPGNLSCTVRKGYPAYPNSKRKFFRRPGSYILTDEFDISLDALPKGTELLVLLAQATSRNWVTR
jgi:hypothetical protein